MHFLPNENAELAGRINYNESITIDDDLKCYV